MGSERVIEGVTAGGVYWNEAHRLPRLLALLKEHFEQIVVVVQESTDGTLEICKDLLDRPGDRVREDAHRGAGDPSFPMMLQTVTTPWTFVVSGDEWPSIDLLRTIPTAITAARMDHHDGVWIKFLSTIEGIEFTNEQDRHLRLFKTAVGWPQSMLHSLPAAQSTMIWNVGHIRHDRSLDEMVVDYLRYISLGRDSAAWTNHNTMMLEAACSGVARHKGWPYVTSRSWWPEVRDIAFGGVDPQ